MAVSSPLALYTWYHQYKKKDLGVGRKDWLQLLREKAKEDGKKGNHINTSAETCETVQKGECGLRQSHREDEAKRELNTVNQRQQHQDDNCGTAAISHIDTKAIKCSPHHEEEQVEDWSQCSSNSEKIEGTQQPSGATPHTPLSYVLNTTLNSPMLLLPQGNNISLEEAPTLPLCSPTLPLCEAFFREDSPRDAIMESLAGNLNGSEVSWSSALATPLNTLHGVTLDHTSPSTLERQTLHPRQRLRENILARSLFSPRTSGAATSSSSGESSPGLGIIKCFSPVPRFNCRSVSAADVKRPCHDESFKPGWLEGGTQGFRVSLNGEKSDSYKQQVVITPEEDRHGNSIKPVLEASEHSHSPQVNLSQECALVRPDQTSTPAQPRPVKARHLALNMQSPEPLDFIEPIPLVPGIKEDERQRCTDPGPREPDVTHADSCRHAQSEDSEYSNDSAEDPFDIICSPVSKVKQRKEKNYRKTKSTLDTLKLKSIEGVPSSPIYHADEEDPADPVLMEVVDSHSRMSSSARAIKNTLTENIDICEDKSLCKNRCLSNREKNTAVEDTEYKQKLFIEEHAVDIACCQTETEPQPRHTMKRGDTCTTTPSTAKCPIAIFTKSNHTISPENISTSRHCVEMTSPQDKNNYILSSSKQKIKSIDMSSLYKKRKLTKGFVYPTDLGEGYEKVNVSFIETIGGVERWDKIEGPGNKEATCSTPKNRLGSEKTIKTVLPESKGATCSTPISRIEERWVEALQGCAEATCSTPASTVRDTPWREAEVPNSKRASCNTPATHTSTTVKQNKFLPLSNLGKRNTSEMSARPSFEPLEPGGNEPKMTKCSEMHKSAVAVKEKRGSDRQHCPLRAVPVASVAPCGRKCMKEIIGREGQPQTHNAATNTLQENRNNRYGTPSRKTEVNFLRNKGNQASIVYPVLSRKVERQCQMDVKEAKGGEVKAREDPITPGHEGPRHHTGKSSLNSQLVGDTFSDIDFSDSDLDVSLPVGEKNIVNRENNDKIKKPDEDNDVHVNDSHEEESFDGNNFSHSMRRSGSIGFVTGNGKQVKVTDKALQQARKLLEEQSCEEESLAPQEVPSGKSPSIDHSSIFHVQRETSHLMSCQPVITNYNNLALSLKGSLTAVSNMPSDTGNNETSKLEPTIHVENACGIPAVNSSCSKELLQVAFAKEASTERSNRTATSSFSHGGNATNQGLDVQDLCDDLGLSMKTGGDSVIQSLQPEAKTTGEGFQDLNMTEDVEEEICKKVLGRPHLHCKENNSRTYAEETKLMKDTKAADKASLDSKAGAFQGFSTASGFQVKVSKKALSKAQMLWEEERADVNMPAFVNKEISKQCGYNVLAKDQSVGLRRAAVPPELKTNIGLLKNEGEMVSHTKCREHYIPGRTLETEIHSINDSKSSNQENNNLKKPSENVMSSAQRDEAMCGSIHVTGDSDGLSPAAFQRIIKSKLDKAGNSSCTLSTVNKQYSSRESVCKDVPNVKNNTTMERKMGFLKANGDKVAVRETSIAQAQLLWKEISDREEIRSQQQQNTLDVHEVHENDVGFHTAKGKKVSVNKSSITQAQLLWREAATSEGTGLDHKAAQDQQYTLINNEGINNEVLPSRELICKPDGISLECMKATPKSHSLQMKCRGSDLSSSKRLFIKETLIEEEKSAVSCGQGGMANTHAKIIEWRNTCDETRTRPQSKDADSVTVPYTDSSTANDGKHIQNKNVLEGASQKMGKLLQVCISSEGSPGNTSKPPFRIEKGPNNDDKRQIATVEPFMVTVDQNSGNANENRQVICGSPILGSQKKTNKEKRVKKMHSLAGSPARQTNSMNTQEITDISDVTEAFLKDQLLDCEDTTKESSSQRKRLRELYLNSEEDSLISHKRMRRSVISQSDYIEDCDAREAARILAWEHQERLVQQKKDQVVQPVPGSLYRLRTERKQERIKLHSCGRLKVYKKRETFSVTFKNAVHYRFEVQNSRCEKIECEDGCVVMLGRDRHVGVEEVELGFLAMPGVDPGLLPPSWIPNHYRLIVWQLAALDRRLLNCQVLTLENVVGRLKYRYDREIDRAQRSILRKITEQDDVPQKTMVLCVASVKLSKELDTREDVKSRATDTRLLPLLELTDGWYSIGAVVDKAMAQLIDARRVEVGTKLVLHGSELVGATSPCHPLQSPSTLRLRLHTNMSRRARWWARLGLLPQCGPLPSTIESTLSDGGLVGEMKVMVARLYPLYYERSQDSVGLFRGEKAHLKRLRETEKQRELLVDQIRDEVEKELHHQKREEDDKRERRAMTPEEIQGLTLGQEISRLLDEAADPSSLEGLLTPHQIQLARTWRERHVEELRQKLHTEVTNRLAKKQKSYEPVPLLKVRIVDGEHGGALVTVWRPPIELRENVSEGSFFTIHYLMAAGFRWRSRQFVSTRQTRWEQSFRGPILWREEFARSVTALCLTTSRDLNPLWQEVDVTGVVLRVGESNPKYQTLYLVDHHLNILAVHFWSGLKKCGYEDNLVEGAVACIMNGSWRGYSGGIIGCIHFSEHSMATLSPSSPHLVEAASHLRSSIKDMKSFLNEASKRMDEVLDSRAFLDKGLHCGEKNEEWKHAISMKDEPIQTDEESRMFDSKADRQDKQAKEVQNKLKLLSQYGSPGYSPRISSPASLHTRKPFRVPLRKSQNRATNEADESI